MPCNRIRAHRSCRSISQGYWPPLGSYSHVRYEKDLFLLSIGSQRSATPDPIQGWTYSPSFGLCFLFASLFILTQSAALPFERIACLLLFRGFRLYIRCLHFELWLACTSPSMLTCRWLRCFIKTKLLFDFFLSLEAKSLKFFKGSFDLLVELKQAHNNCLLIFSLA
jgi:hypothetical protein